MRLVNCLLATSEQDNALTILNGCVLVDIDVLVKPPVFTYIIF